MRRTKCVYLRALAASTMMLPTDSEYTCAPAAASDTRCGRPGG